MFTQFPSAQNLTLSVARCRESLLTASEPAQICAAAQELRKLGIQWRGHPNPRGTPERAAEYSLVSAEQCARISRHLGSDIVEVKTSIIGCLGEWGSETEARVLAHHCAGETDFLVKDCCFFAFRAIGGRAATAALVSEICIDTNNAAPIELRIQRLAASALRDLITGGLTDLQEGTTVRNLPLAEEKRQIKEALEGGPNNLRGTRELICCENAEQVLEVRKLLALHSVPVIGAIRDSHTLRVVGLAGEARDAVRRQPLKIWVDRIQGEIDLAASTVERPIS